MEIEPKKQIPITTIDKGNMKSDKEKSVEAIFSSLSNSNFAIISKFHNKFTKKTRKRQILRNQSQQATRFNKHQRTNRRKFRT